MKRAKLITGFSVVFFLAACAGIGDKPLTAKGLFDRHVKVAYGGKGMSVHQSITQHGTLFIDDFGIEAPLVSKIMAPGNMVFETDIMGMAMSQGCNAQGCWNIQPGAGDVAVEGDMLDMFKRQADIRVWEHVEDYYPSLEIVPADDPDNATEYTVKATSANGREDLYYFSKETGLMVGSTTKVNTPMGEITQNTAMKDYKEFGGVWWPTTTEQSSSMVNARIVIDDVSYDALSESDFVQPE